MNVPSPSHSRRWLTKAAVALVALAVGVLGAPAAQAAPGTPPPRATSPGNAPAAAAPTSATRGLRVMSPREDSLQPGAMSIVVRVPEDARKVTVRVGTRDVTERLRGRGALRTVRVPAGIVPAGRATIAVRARALDGRALFAHSSVVVGRQRPTLLAGEPSLSRAHGTATLTFKLRARPDQLRINLNGRQVHLLRTPDAGRVSVPLAADDGLRFGANTVTIKAVENRSGRWARATERFRMSRTTPLASAGADTRTSVGAPVTLNASGTRPTTGTTTPTFRWRVVDQPRGAGARLVDATAARPGLRTNRPGHYQIAVDVREPGREVATDTVSVEVEAAVDPYGTPLTTLVPNGDGTTRTTIQGVPITSGGDDHLDLPANAAQLIVLDRSTLEYDPTHTRQLSVASPLDVADLLTYVKQLSVHQLAILTGAPGCCLQVPFLGADLSKGFTLVLAGGSLDPMISNAGNTTVGSIWTEGGRTAGAISALVRPSQTLTGNDVFTIAYPDAVTFDSKVTDKSVTGGEGFNIQLGGNNFNFQGEKGIGVVYIAADLETPLGRGGWALNGDASDARALQQVTAYLDDNATANPGSVMLLQTWGSPKANTTAWGDVGNALTQYGGTSSVWNALDGTGDYALVGRAGAGASTTLQGTASAEESAPLSSGTASTTAKTTAGTVRGVLGRGSDSLPIVTGSTPMPVTASVDVNGKTSLPNPNGLTVLAQAAPQPWPAMGGGGTAAYAWVSQQVGEPFGIGDPGTTAPGGCYQPTTWDLRSAYCNTADAGSWSSTILTNLRAVSCPSTNSDFTAAECEAVVTQLEAEFPKISPVVSMFDRLQQPLTNSQAAMAVDFVNAADAVDTSMSETVPSPTFGLQEFVSDFAQPLQDLDGPVGASFAIGLFASALDMALSATTDGSGNPALDQFDSTKAAIGTDAVQRLTTASQQMAVVQNMVLTDWTKLSTAAYNANNIWGQNGLTTNQQTVIVQSSTKAWLYQAMIPLAYSQITLNPTGGLTAAGVNAYTCRYGSYPGEYTRWPFRPGATPNFQGQPSGGRALPASAVFAPTTATLADGTAVAPFVWALGDAVGSESFQTPTAALTDPLFQPISNSGVGLYPEQFYSWGWVSQNRHPMSDFIGKGGLDYAYDCS